MSAKELVEQFVKMDVEGERTTPEGWRKADFLFSTPSNTSQLKSIVVIARSYAVSPSGSDSNQNKLYFGYEEVGRLALSTLRFTPTRNGHMKEFHTYTVVSMRQTPGSGESAKQRNSTGLAFAIEGTQPSVTYLTAKAAMRVVKQATAKTVDLTIRKNADQAVAKLAAYQ
jgi:hypothetical protein